MIRSNLIKRESVVNYQAGKWLAPILAVALVIQFLFMGVNYVRSNQKREEFVKACDKLDALKEEHKKLAISEDLEDLAGKVAARNNWFIDRKNSPLNKLAKLQRDCPNNVRFLSYNADMRSGKIMLTAPDLNSVTSWLNSHFNNKGNTSVTGRENNLLMIQFIWSG
jgi:hypothetical protein